MNKLEIVVAILVMLIFLKVAYKLGYDDRANAVWRETKVLKRQNANSLASAEFKEGLVEGLDSLIERMKP